MSKRELIAINLADTLKASEPGYKFSIVTREPFDFERLSNAQFPAILVRSANENREDSTIGGSLTKRNATIDYQVVCYVKAKDIDKARNEAIQRIEEKLDADRTRGGYALDTQIISIDADDGSIDPIGGVIITVRCIYQFTRGAT
tara:strand:- start:7914 stop:8348 length:435 start_codon:yes stop_codon:yes gene_type:complete